MSSYTRTPCTLYRSERSGLTRMRTGAHLCTLAFFFVSKRSNVSCPTWTSHCIILAGHSGYGGSDTADPYPYPLIPLPATRTGWAYPCQSLHLVKSQKPLLNLSLGMTRWTSYKNTPMWGSPSALPHETYTKLTMRKKPARHDKLEDSSLGWRQP